MASQWPALGRSAQLAAIDRVLHAPGLPTGVVLTGGAGVGKTSLARDVLRASRKPFRWVVGTETARSVPFGAFSHLISVTAPIEPASVLRTARKEVVAGGGILGVDDAHLLDNFSATLVHQIAMTGAAKLIVTIRDGEPAPDAVTALWKDEWLSRIDLPGFTREETVELAEQALGGKLEDPSADRIFQVSEGNPLFLRHVIEGARAAGTLRKVAGVWQLRGHADVSKHLFTLIETRIIALPGELLRVLELLALAEPLELDVLSDLASVDAIEAAERDGLVRVLGRDAGLVVRLGHPVYGEVLVKRIARDDARRIRGEIVRRVAQDRPANLVNQIRLAALALDSDLKPDPNMLADAARDALRLGDVDLGERLARGAKAAGGGFYASLYLSHMLAWQSRGDEAEAELATYDPDTLADFDRVQQGLVRASNMFWTLGRADDGRAILDRLRVSAAEPMFLDLCDALDSMLVLFMNRPEETSKIVDRVIDSPSCTPLALAWAAAAGAVARAVTGRLDDVAPLADRGLEAARIAESGMLSFTIGLGQTLALLASGQADAARRIAGEHAELAEMQQPGRAQAGVVLGRVLIATGAIEAACDELRQASAVLESTSYAWAMMAPTYVAQAYGIAGEAVQARDALQRAEAHHGKRSALFEPDLHLARAWVAASAGDLDTAKAAARDAASAATESGQVVVATQALVTAARFGDPTVAADLEDVAHQAPCVFTVAAATLGRALADDDGPALFQASAAFEDAGMLLVAADVAALASAAYARAGNPAGEVSAATAAQRLSALCPGAQTPALRQVARSTPLTNREQEVAAMVATGLSNKEIADELVVSVRTVEGHIYRACSKLRVADRAALAAVVRAEMG